MTRREKYGHCALCNRVCALTFHHLIPRKLHRRVYFRKNFARDALNRGLDICRACHDGIHERYDEMTLARRFSSFEALRDDPAMRKHIAWVAKQKVG